MNINNIHCLQQVYAGVFRHSLHTCTCIKYSECGDCGAGGGILFIIIVVRSLSWNMNHIKFVM